MSLLKTDSTIDLEKRVETLEKQMKKILKILGKSTSKGSDESDKEDILGDDYCSIS